VDNSSLHTLHVSGPADAHALGFEPMDAWTTSLASQQDQVLSHFIPPISKPQLFLGFI
jgi:hypothetical protein